MTSIRLPAVVFVVAIAVAVPAISPAANAGIEPPNSLVVGARSTGGSAAPDAAAVGMLDTGGIGATAAASTSSGPGFGTYRCPVHGPVIRPYEQPADPFSAGHRGIDIAAPFGTPIRAPADGVVSFAGTVAGSLYISIDHAGGVRTSYSWVSSVAVKKGQAVRAGEVIGATGQGHPGSDRTHLHFSARLDGIYVDPMLLLGGGNLVDVIHLAEA